MEVVAKVSTMDIGLRTRRHTTVFLLAHEGSVGEDDRILVAGKWILAVSAAMRTESSVAAKADGSGGEGEWREYCCF